MSHVYSLRLDDDVLARLQERARRTGRTLAQVMRDALAHEPSQHAATLQVTSTHGGFTVMTPMPSPARTFATGAVDQEAADGR